MNFYTIKQKAITKEGHLYILVHFYKTRNEQIKDTPLLIEDFIFVIDTEYNVPMRDENGNYITVSGNTIPTSSEFQQANTESVRMVTKQRDVVNLVQRTINSYMQKNTDRKGDRTLKNMQFNQQDTKGLLSKVVSLRNKVK